MAAMQCSQALSALSAQASCSKLCVWGEKPYASATRKRTYAMPAETFDGQITRANAQLAVRSGVLTEAEAARYWQTRRRYRTLPDSNSQKTIDKRTAEFEEAKARVPECMNTSASTLLERERGEKRKLEGRSPQVEAAARRRPLLLIEGAAGRAGQPPGGSGSPDPDSGPVGDRYRTFVICARVTAAMPCQ